MAFNLNALKGLFSKLKPAAKAAANYGDDVASAVANYGDDAAKALTTYGDDVARAVDNADDLVRRGLVPANKQTATGDALEALYNYQIANGTPVLAPDDVLDDMYLASSGNSYVANSDPTRGISLYTPGTESDDYLRKFGDTDWTLSTDYWGRQHPVRKDDLAEFASLEQLDPDAYKSGLDGTPEKFVIAPEMFGGGGGYDNRLVGSFSYPDGFINPEAAAMYYDSLERGYVPVEYLDIGNEIRYNWARDDVSRVQNGLPRLYEELQAELGSDAFSNTKLSAAFKDIPPRTFKRMLMRRR